MKARTELLRRLRRYARPAIGCAFFGAGVFMFPAALSWTLSSSDDVGWGAAEPFGSIFLLIAGTVLMGRWRRTPPRSCTAAPVRLSEAGRNTILRYAGSIQDHRNREPGEISADAKVLAAWVERATETADHYARMHALSHAHVNESGPMPASEFLAIAAAYYEFLAGKPASDQPGAHPQDQS